GRGPLAVVEGPPELALDEPPAAGDEADGARIVERTSDRVCVETTSSGKRLLVLSELFVPGVSVTVDNARERAVCADAALVGVPLAPGAHSVVLTFGTPGLLFGVLLSCMSAVALWKLVSGSAQVVLEPAPFMASREPRVSLGEVFRVRLRRATRSAPARAPRK